jgi:hypothetical protein
VWCAKPATEGRTQICAAGEEERFFMASRDNRNNAALGGSLLGIFDPDQRTSNKRGSSLINAFPLLAIPFAIYNVLALVSGFGGDSNAAYMLMTQSWFTLPMPGGAHWAVSIGDIILFVSLICLFFELLKSTNSDNVAIVNHSLSMLLFIVCLVEFLLLRPFSTSTFFLLMCMTLMDVVAGFIVTAISARKDIDFGGGH